MKKVIVLFVCLYTSLSNPVKNADFTYRVELENGNITYESNIIHQNYSYKVETSDGTIRTEKGHLENNSLVVEGTYEYLGENNFKYAVTYLADKNGYHPKMIFDFGAENITHKGDPPHRTTTTKTTTHSATTEKANSTTAKPKGKDLLYLIRQIYVLRNKIYEVCPRSIGLKAVAVVKMSFGQLCP